MSFQDHYKQEVSILRKAGIDSAELDARVLISHALKKDFGYLLAHPEVEISNYDIKRINVLISRRAKNEPIAYITGHKEFYGLDFLVNKNVLIPRPESEALIDKSLEFIKLKVNKIRKINILDIGTGSGNIVISILKQLKIENCKLKIDAYASDISKKALEIAKKNAKIYEIDNIKFIQSDLFENIKGEFDLIIANLPYVPQNSNQTTDYGLQPNFEPKMAIFADDNGAGTIKRFLTEAKDHLKKDSLVLIELDHRNAEDIKKYAQDNYPNAKVELKKDLAGFDRYLILHSAF